MFHLATIFHTPTPHMTGLQCTASGREIDLESTESRPGDDDHRNTLKTSHSVTVTGVSSSTSQDVRPVHYGCESPWSVLQASSFMRQWQRREWHPLGYYCFKATDGTKYKHGKIPSGNMTQDVPTGRASLREPQLFDITV